MLSALIAWASTQWSGREASTHRRRPARDRQQISLRFEGLEPRRMLSGDLQTAVDEPLELAQTIDLDKRNHDVAPQLEETPTAGVLRKTWHSYLTRESADITGMPDYSTSDWSAEIALDIDGYDYIGDYGEFFRHGVRYSSFNANSPGWNIGTQSTGYSARERLSVMASLSDGNGHIIQLFKGSQFGRLHIVVTYDVSVSSLRLYVNGELVGTKTEPAMQMPADPNGPLAIGATNKINATYEPKVDGTAMPAFDVFFARVWADDLTPNNVAEIHSRWTATGQSQPPASISAKIASHYLMNVQVGDEDGNPGTGWLMDASGLNHLKIVDSGAPSGPTSFIHISTGDLRGIFPTNGATNISGAVKLQADGIVGDKHPMQYLFEIDETPTFDGRELQRSDWQLGIGQWQPGLKPSTKYYWRVKARDASAGGMVSNWSRVYSFETREPRTWYVRPKAEPGTYGREDGTSYDDAWNDLRWNGGQGGMLLSELMVQADFNRVAPGDTVYVTDTWGLMESDTWSLRSTNRQLRMIRTRGYSSKYPVYVRMNHEAYPASFYQFFRYTGNYAWRREGEGIYSTAEYLQVSRMAIDANGVPNIDIHSPDADTLLYRDNSKALTSPGFYYENGRMFVRLPDDRKPENRLWYLVSGVSTFGLRILSSQYLHLVGGEFYGGAPEANIEGSENTHLTIRNTKIKYSPGSAAIPIGNFDDNWMIDSVEISYAANGIYGFNTGPRATRRTGDNITIRNSYIHHIGVPGWSDSDAHAVGIQAGNGWIIEDNLFEHTGTAVEIWTSSGKESRDHKIRRNIIKDVVAKDATFGAGIALSQGRIEIGLRDGIEIVDNVIWNTEGSGIHSAVSDPILIRGNLLIHVGYGPNDFSHDGISFRNVPSDQPVNATITSNVVVDPRRRFLNLRGAISDIDGLRIDQNVYWDRADDRVDGVLRFVANGYDATSRSFSQWAAETPFDHNSLATDPASAALPERFDALKVDIFLADEPGDLNGDNRVTTSDVDLLIARSGPKGPLPAYLRFLQQQVIRTDTSVPGPPLVRGLVRNGGDERFYALETIQFVFSEDVRESLSADDLKISELASGQLVDLSAAVFDSAAAKWDLSGVAIPVGVYLLSLGARGIEDTNGNVLDGNSDGMAGDDFVSTQVVAIKGDIDFDGDVDFDDIDAFGSALQNPDAYFRAFGAFLSSTGDLDGDGTVDYDDIDLLREIHAPESPVLANSPGTFQFASNLLLQATNTEASALDGTNSVTQIVDRTIGFAIMESQVAHKLRTGNHI